MLLLFITDHFCKCTYKFPRLQATCSVRCHVNVTQVLRTLPWSAVCKQVVNKVRGKLSKLERKTLSALIVVDVHARDVATELATQGVSSETDFEWMSQLR